MSSLASAAAPGDSGLSQAVPNGAQANASRNARSFIFKWGLVWKVPISVLRCHTDDGQDLEVPYISPLAFIKFLIEKAPELLFGGADLLEGQKMLKSFWGAYKQTHGTHEVFREHASCTSHVIPLCLHGDEGRGLKKTNTCVMTLESIFGLSTGDNIMCGKHFNSCRCCSQRGLDHQEPCKTEADEKDTIPPTAFQEINLQHHPFLTKFLLLALPQSVFKQNGVLELLIQQISSELRQLFFEGVYARGIYWFGAVIGLKGDLAWFAKIGKLTRCYKHLASGTGSCHECAAGAPGKPLEDISRQAAWRTSLYETRPWSSGDPPMFDKIPYDKTTPERILKRDFFHCSKIGTFRDFVGSSVLLIVRLGYFNQVGALNNQKVLLQRAFGHFRLYCCTVGKHPSMHPFTKDNFNCASKKKFPWCRTKGSDTMLLIEWLQYLSRACLNDPMDESHKDILEMVNWTARAGTSWSKSLYKHGMWLSRTCANALAKEGNAFLRGFNSLAHASLHSTLLTSLEFCGYGMKPKLHLLCHEIYDIRRWLADPAITWIPNTLMFGCESNEDVIGKLSRIIRRLHQKQVSRAVIERYLMKTKALYTRLKRAAKPNDSRKRVLSPRLEKPPKSKESIRARKDFSRAGGVEASFRV